MRVDFSQIQWKPATQEELSDRISDPEILSYWQDVDPHTVDISSSEKAIYFRHGRTVVVQSKKRANDRYCGTCFGSMRHRSPAYAREDHNFLGEDVTIPRCTNSDHLTKLYY